MVETGSVRVEEKTMTDRFIAIYTHCYGGVQAQEQMRNGRKRGRQSGIPPLPQTRHKGVSFVPTLRLGCRQGLCLGSQSNHPEA